MVLVSGLLFVLPVTQRLFLLDPGNTGHTLTALGCAAAGILLIELGWWLGGRLHRAR